MTWYCSISIMTCPKSSRAIRWHTAHLWSDQLAQAFLVTKWLYLKPGGGGGGGGGALRYIVCRCAHAWTMVLKYTPKHNLVMMQKITPKQVFCLKFDPLNRFLSNLSKFWQNHGPLYAFPAIHILMKKKTPFYTYFWSCMCTAILSESIWWFGTGVNQWPIGRA